MVTLFALVAGCLAAAGLYIAGIGVVDGFRSDWGPGILAIWIGAFVTYGAYLFGRAAWRTRRASATHPATAAEKTARHRIVRGLVQFALAQAVFLLGLPLAVPTFVRVISVVGAFLVIPLVLVREFEPAKRRRKSSG